MTLFHFEELEHTADLALKVHGHSLKEVFINAACGLFSLMADLESLSPSVSREVYLEAPDRESLLVDWLNELLYFFDTELFLGSRYEIRELSRDHLSADVWGERYDEHRHRIRRVIKAVTYHQLSVRECQGRWEARVVFDL